MQKLVVRVPIYARGRYALRSCHWATRSTAKAAGAADLSEGIWQREATEGR